METVKAVHRRLNLGRFRPALTRLQPDAAEAPSPARSGVSALLKRTRGPSPKDSDTSPSNGAEAENKENKAAPKGSKVPRVSAKMALQAALSYSDETSSPNPSTAAESLGKPLLGQWRGKRMAPRPGGRILAATWLAVLVFIHGVRHVLSGVR